MAILGSWPPPAGGVAIHTQRLCSLLDRQGVNYVVYNATSDVGDGQRVIGVWSRRRSWLLGYLFNAKEHGIYLFSARLSAWIIGALLARFRGKRVVLRLRNAQLLEWMANSRWRRLLCGWTFRQLSAVVCVNRQLADASVRLGVAPERVHWSPGFLPPRPDETERGGVAPEVWTFAAQHGPIIAANGKADHYNGVDLYGLDMLVELAGRMRGEHPQLGIIICFWEHRPEEESALEALRARARELGVADNICFNTCPGPFVPVLAIADIFVRPTATDGDANSIREALYLEVPSVASDVVERPAGTHLFRNRDLDALETCVRTVLTSRPALAERQPRLAADDQRRIDAYLDLITALAENRPLPKSRPWQTTAASAAKP